MKKGQTRINATRDVDYNKIEIKHATFYNEGGELVDTYAVFIDGKLTKEFLTWSEAEAFIGGLNGTV